METLWYETDPDTLRCCFCHLKFGSAALIRTFRLHDLDQENKPSGHSKIIKTPSGENMFIYDRHLQCLLQTKVKYSAISHVWDPEVSRMQCFGRHIPQPPKVRREVFKSAQFIYRGLLKSGAISDLDEIWYDYISVPQWVDNIKDRILLAIPEIYGSAHMTTIHFQDLHKDVIHSLYNGQTTDERIKAITGVCNLEWFTRVWTATEYVRSRQIISMDGEGNLCSKCDDPVFLKRLLQVWFDEAHKHESIHHLEARAEIGKNLVPWNLGPLLDMGKAKSSVFGQAFALLSKRRCRSNHDFLHALLGLVEPTSDQPLLHNFDQDYKRIAKLCLAAGDYSPLLVAARPEEHEKQYEWGIIHEKQYDWEIVQGFNDLEIWPLGAGRKRPDLHRDFLFENGDLENGNPILKLQRIGVILQVHDNPGDDPMEEFAHNALIVLKATGPDLDSFIDTLGWRLYDERVDFIKQKLAASNQTDQLAEVLRQRYSKELEDSWLIEGSGGARWVAEAMTLSLTEPGGSAEEPGSKLAWLNAHGGTIHSAQNDGDRLLSISCTACHRLFIFRAGLFESPDDVVGSTAYRIPGLKYQFSHEDGMGICLKNGRVVGRLAWATAACKCSEVEMVKIQMSTLPAPSPRPYSFDLP